MEFRFSYIAVLPLLLSVSCSPMFTVKSDPIQADVYVQDPKTGEKKAVGRTPLELPASTLRQQVGPELLQGEYFTLWVEKQGFLPEKFAVPSSKFGTLVTSVDAKLKTGEAKKEEGLAREILNRLFLAQRFARTREFERAQAELDRIVAIAPDFARAHSMRGSIYFVQKKYAESLKWYEEAVKADPQLEEAAQMIAKVRAIQGGKREPASATPTKATPAPAAPAAAAGAAKK